MHDQGIGPHRSFAKEGADQGKKSGAPEMFLMAVYKGEQSFREWLALLAQGRLFEEPERDRAIVQNRLNVTALRVVTEFGRDADDFELRHIIKDRFVGKGVYDSGMVGAALDAALRERKRL